VTYLRTEDGALVVVPNGNLFNETVVVRSAGGGAPEAAGEPPRELKP
jgi:small-conductance mechanosensitive channel